MFKKRELKMGDGKNDDYATDFVSKQKLNTILKGSKLIGDITVSYDLELSGEVDGNITSKEDSNIVIKGRCNGNIETKGGNVTIEGELINGDIIAGADVRVTGKFSGGKVKAKGKLYINGEFNGKLEGNEIEVGPNASGEGELFYKEYISITRGAKIEAQIGQIQEEVGEVSKHADIKIVNMDIPVKEASTK